MARKANKAAATRCAAAVGEWMTYSGIRGRPRVCTGYHRCERAAKVGDLCAQHDEQARLQAAEPARAYGPRGGFTRWADVHEKSRRRAFSDLPGGRWGPPVAKEPRRGR